MKINMDKVKKIKGVEKELNSFIVEREELIKLLTVSIMGEFNIFLIGDTGQAKSYVVNEFARRIEGLNYFYMLMNKQVDSSSIFGKLDIPALVNGQQKVLTKGMATEANISFYDEIWKTDDIVANTLLNIWNEKEVVLEGQLYKVPVICNICASNEIPDFKTSDGAILKPLYDRLDFIFETEYISEKNNYLKALKAKRNKLNQNIQNTIKLDEVNEIIDMVGYVECDDSILELVWKVKDELHTKLGRRLSDRKLLNIEKVLKAHALYNERDKVIEEDILILKYYFIYYPEELKIVEEVLETYAVNPLQSTILTYNAMQQEIFEAAKDIKNIDNDALKDKELDNLYESVIKVYDMYENLNNEKLSVNEKEMVEKAVDDLEESFKKIVEENERTYLRIPELKRIMKRNFI